MNNQTVPFTIPDVNLGFAEVKGLLKITGEAIILEFESKDAFLGVIKSEVKEERISFDDIERVEWKKGFFSSKIIIFGKSMRALSEIPGSDHGKLTLKFRRRDRDRAADTAGKLRMDLSEYKLNELEE